MIKKSKIILLITSINLIILPLIINKYSIYKLFLLIIGIILLDIYVFLNKKNKLNYAIFLPIMLLIITYGIDYIKTAVFKISPIFVLENKINEKVSIYNSLLYRVYKCNQEYILDNLNYNGYVCDSHLLNNNDINILLSEPLESYQKYQNDFIKVTGKISKIIGNSSIDLKTYIKDENNNLNGYVKFYETSNLKIILKGLDVTNYHIYDYITVIGLVSNYNKDKSEIILTNPKIVENNLYTNYDFQIIESVTCDNSLKEYTENLYTYCTEDIYLDFGVDKYELSYVLKDKKITIEQLIEKSEHEELENGILYKLDKINILSCNNEKNIVLKDNEKIEKSWCLE